MKDTVIKKLMDEYNSIAHKGEETCVKYCISINDDVIVNLYFDNFDIDNPNLVMIIVCDRIFFFTNLAYKSGRFSNFINFINESSNDYRVISKILDEHKTLNAFYAKIENNILRDIGRTILYTSDNIFCNTIRYNKKANEELPFVQTIKKAKMTDKMYRYILETSGISNDLLDKFRSAGYTFVRTGDPSKRNKISFLLQKIS